MVVAADWQERGAGHSCSLWGFIETLTSKIAFGRLRGTVIFPLMRT